MDSRLIIVETGDAKRLDVFLAEELDITRSFIKQLIDKGSITLNGKEVKSGKEIRRGDEIRIEFPEPATAAEPEDLPVKIIYEDDDIAVIDKAKGMVVHPGGGAKSGTLVNALMHSLKSLSAINGTLRPGIVHRLDKDTSGVMVVAKNDAAHLSLARQIAERKVKKLYLAILDGVLKNDEGEIKTFISRSRADRKLMCVSPDGKEAVTRYTVLERFREYTLVRFDILTGRTHQIRVHAKHIGHPVTGDKQYGAKKQKFTLSGQLLHAFSLTFAHPATGKEMTFESEPDEEFMRVLTVLRNEK